ncbi:GPP34 family phosphoprotein, partial [Streptomyces sp. 2MCAF27]
GRRALGLLPVKEYEVERPDVVAGRREVEVRLLRGGQSVSEVSAGDAALVALAAAGELRTVVTAADARAHKARIAELARRSGQVGPALEKALGQVRSAVAVAVTGVTLSGTLAAAG